ncbi:hypothetical protein OUZ56_030523 [Daphnia magna]|uniref:Uncharacterized protein n=1 Tax=Daphnia magna TaxID=35525 RepID=A0ABQ9ZSW9_9CRUS|nr:hypothetical protein OUZ56_030523 [Daphnia magna]
MYDRNVIPFSQNGGIPFSDGFTINGTGVPTPVMEQTQHLVPRRMMEQTQHLVSRQMMPQTWFDEPRDNIFVYAPVLIQNRIYGDVHGAPYQQRPLNRHRIDDVRYSEDDQIYQDQSFHQERCFRRDADLAFNRHPRSDTRYHPADAHMGCSYARNCRCRREHCHPDCDYEHQIQYRSCRRDEYDRPGACHHPKRRRPNGCLADEFIRDVCDECTGRHHHPPRHCQFPEESRLSDYQYDDYDQTAVVQRHKTTRNRCDYRQDPAPPAPSFQQCITKEIVHRSNCDCKNCTHGVGRTERRTSQGSQERVPITKSEKGKPGRKISVATGDHHGRASRTVGNPEQADERRASYADQPWSTGNDNSNSYPDSGDAHSKPTNENGTGEEGKHEDDNPPEEDKDLNRHEPEEDPESQTLQPPEVPEEDKDLNRHEPEEDPESQTLQPSEFPEEDKDLNRHEPEEDPPSQTLQPPEVPEEDEDLNRHEPEGDPDSQTLQPPEVPEEEVVIAHDSSNEQETPEVEAGGDEMPYDSALPDDYSPNPEVSQKRRPSTFGSILGNKLSDAAGKVAERGKGAIDSIADNLDNKRQKATDTAINATKNKAQDLKTKANEKSEKLKKNLKNKVDDVKQRAKAKAEQKIEVKSIKRQKHRSGSLTDVLFAYSVLSAFVFTSFNSSTS